LRWLTRRLRAQLRRRRTGRAEDDGDEGDEGDAEEVRPSRKRSACALRALLLRV